ncbi:glycosyltransferase family 4 protein [Sphingomonas sp.]|uniref:glycosyltransferase family 4 protein n=1 Tax=Sphingomonas sp. TaxID=28214 RepID=UPI003AFFFB89
MLDGADGTGVSSYARALMAAAALGGWTPSIVHATRGQGAVARLARWATAASGRRRPLRLAGGDLVGDDIFRVAQIHFDWWRRPLVLDAPGPPGIAHWTYPLPLRIAGWANLYTIHDVIPLAQPELTSISPDRHRRLLSAIMHPAAGLVTVSAAAKADIVRATGCAPDFVTDCGQAALLPEPDRETPAGLRRGGYFVYCGLIEPRKNLLRLIAAHARAATGLPLVIVGPDGWRAGPILAAIAAGGDVLRLSYQERPALAALIRDARALLFPSLAEGFGLPVAEAMTLGTPTLISRDPALVEVAGRAALSVDGEDVDAIAAGIARMASDDALRARLSTDGLARARDFSLDRFAERLGRLYASLA